MRPLIEPQNPASSPTPCAGSIPEAAGRAILAAADQEHVDPTLLSVTWRHEAIPSFGSNPQPNPRWEGRGRNRRLVGWDVGPMQISTNYYQKSPFTYDGDGLRVKKSEYGSTTWYLRSSVLGGQVIAEIDGNAVWQRGYVYAGSSLMAVQQGGVFWMHEDPVTKSERTTDASGNVVSSVELDPWGADTSRSSSGAFQPKKYTSYDRDGNGSDEAMFRRYNRKHSRFDQPDPYVGSYDLSNPQSFNRYAYVQNDPVNFVDPTGLMMVLCGPGGSSDGATIWRCEFVGDDLYKFGGFTGGGGKGTGTVGGTAGKASQKQDTRSTCERMADDAQRIANGILNDLKNMYNRVSPADSLRLFNVEYGLVTFGSYMTESPLGFVGTQASGRNNVLGTRYYAGQDGFDRQFWDEAEMKAGDPNPDQVHHFGAYFSAGLTGHKAGPDWHRADDRREGHMGDVRLSDQSRRLGDYLRRNPAELRNVGQLIRDTICGGGAVPK